MARYFKDDSPRDKILQEIEAVLKKHGVTLSAQGYGALSVQFKDGVVCSLADAEGGEAVGELPRSFSSERLRISGD